MQNETHACLISIERSRICDDTEDRDRYIANFSNAAITNNVTDLIFSLKSAIYIIYETC